MSGWFMLAVGLLVLGYFTYRWFVPTPRQRAMIALAESLEEDFWASNGQEQDASAGAGSEDK